MPHLGTRILGIHTTHNQQLVTVINCYHWTDKGDDDRRCGLITEHDVKSITSEIKLLEMLSKQ